MMTDLFSVLPLCQNTLDAQASFGKKPSDLLFSSPTPPPSSTIRPRQILSLPFDHSLIFPSIIHRNQCNKSEKMNK